MRTCEFLKSHNIIFDKEPTIDYMLFDMLSIKNAQKAYDLIIQEPKLINVYEYVHDRRYIQVRLKQDNH